MSPARVAGVAIPLGVGLLLAVLLVLHARADARTKTMSTVRAVVASSVTKVRTELRNELAAAGAGDAIATVPPNKLAGAPMSAAVAITARDAGTATLDDTGKRAVIVVPVYRGGAVPPTTAARRAAIEAYRVVPLMLQPTLADLQPIL